MRTNNTLNIGQKIKLLRKHASMPRNELASLLGISQESIKKYEQGTRTPSLETIEKLASVFGIIPEDLDYRLCEKYKDLANKKSVCLHFISKTEGKIHEIKSTNSIVSSEKSTELSEKFSDLEYYKNELIKIDMKINSLIEEYSNKPFVPEVRANKDFFQSADNEIIIDTDIDPTHPYNIAMQKQKAGKELTPEEQQALDEYAKSEVISDAIERFKSSVSEFGENVKRLHEIYDQLNDAGQEKVVEHAEMLAKIPEYRKE